jgi:hypothetical protein
VRLLCVFVRSCVQVASLRRADPPSKESYRLCKTEKATKAQQRPVEPHIDTHGEKGLMKDNICLLNGLRRQLFVSRAGYKKWHRYRTGHSLNGNNDAEEHIRHNGAVLIM